MSRRKAADNGTGSNYLHDVGEEGGGHEADGDVHNFKEGSGLDDLERAVATEGDGADDEGLGSDLGPEFAGFEVVLEVASDGKVEDVGPSGTGQKVVQHEVQVCDFHGALLREATRRGGSIFEA